VSAEYSYKFKVQEELKMGYYAKFRKKRKPRKKGCYIATAVYGSYDCHQVWTLRRYRDYTLARTWYGRMFIKLYYAISPTLVKWFGKTDWFKKIWRYTLNKIINRLQNQGVESTSFIDQDWY
jgi:hypothetical protein